MRLIFTTEDFTYGGLARPGFPVILGRDMQPVQPFQDFLIWRLLGRGFPLSPLTWEGYGRRLWDYAMFLDANGVAWDMPFDAPGKSPAVRYRDWSLRELSLSRKTVNARLRLVGDFYEWAHARGLVLNLPFSYRSMRARRIDHLLMHVSRPSEGQARGLEVREWSAPPEFLTMTQMRLARAACTSAGRAILFNLMSRVGLRSVEARTFPLSYVFNPAQRADCQPDQMIRVRLNPRDMSTKFAKPREVDVPFTLMQQMYSYILYERNRLASTSGTLSPALVLTASGRPFSKDAVVGMFGSLSAAVGFRVTALMLRHSYAIHTLTRLRAQPDYAGEPLLYVRDRLGHSDVQTTLVYLRQIEQLAGGLVLAVEEEIDRLFQPVGKSTGASGECFADNVAGRWPLEA